MEDQDIEPMMTRNQVAEYIGKRLAVSERQVYDRWVYLPDFPKAIVLPSMTGKKRATRYERSEIIEWVENLERRKM